mmetsp:Transcript_46229/g.51688  ORF Transcript_46229/g.51688 Transcript_46229/m.51688 type:complete len:128 (-) Transcript_46229:388-771(-)
MYFSFLGMHATIIPVDGAGVAEAAMRDIVVHEWQLLHSSCSLPATTTTTTTTMSVVVVLITTVHTTLTTTLTITTTIPLIVSMFCSLPRRSRGPMFEPIFFWFFSMVSVSTYLSYLPARPPSSPSSW